MNKILCIGEALIDMICTDKGKPLSEGENFLKKPGGAPTNVAAAIAALGGEVELAAKTGNDPFGNYLVQIMKNFGVGTKHIIQDNRHFTTLAFVSLMENGERDFYFNRGADGELSKEETDLIDLDEFSIVHFGSATAFLPGPLKESYSSLLNKAVEKKLFISFDPNYRHLLFGYQKEYFIEKSWSFISQSNFFKVSDEEAMMLTSKTSAEEASKVFFEKTNAVFAITIGKEGALLGINGKTILVPGIQITPVDTTGAGDAFTGAVLYQLSLHPLNAFTELPEEVWQAVIKKGNIAGARTCEHMGAMEAFKHLDNQLFN